jgi:hypothetical protein
LIREVSIDVTRFTRVTVLRAEFNFIRTLYLSLHDAALAARPAVAGTPR